MLGCRCAGFLVFQFEMQTNYVKSQVWDSTFHVNLWVFRQIMQNLEFLCKKSSLGHHIPGDSAGFRTNYVKSWLRYPKFDEMLPCRMSAEGFPSVGYNFLSTFGFQDSAFWMYRGWQSLPPTVLPVLPRWVDIHMKSWVCGLFFQLSAFGTQDADISLHWANRAAVLSGIWMSRFGLSSQFFVWSSNLKCRQTT